MTLKQEEPWPFVKMQGLGNDFILLDFREGEREHPPEALIARALCDRHLGIGADGVLFLLPSNRAAARMRVLNADGSVAEMCGNGLRCVARYLWERRAERTQAPRISVETDAGVLECMLLLGVDGVTVEMVEVAMGRPCFLRGEIPMAGDPLAPCVHEPVEVAGRSFLVTGIGMGNPHAVIFVEGDEPLRQMAERLGPELERHPWFPERTNVEFARLRGPLDIELWVWERGCGITMACGTGACATASAAVKTGRAPAGKLIAMHLPGGSLGILVESDLGQIHMRGPCQTVFEGHVWPDRLVL